MLEGRSPYWLIGMVLWGLVNLPSAIAQESLRVGVRVDAAPFAWKDEDGAYRGLIVELCEYAFEAENLDFMMVDASVGNRLKRLVSTADEKRAYDVLCDPTSMTINRARDYFLSPPIFVSGGSYLTSDTANVKFLREASTSFQERAEAGERTTGADGGVFESVVSEAEKTAPQAQIPNCSSLPESAIVGAKLGYVIGTTGRDVIDRAWASGVPPLEVSRYQTICAKGFASHELAVEALCAGGITHHFGDRDIIDFYRRSYVPAEDKPCDAATAETFYTSEPYAIAISPELDGVTARKVIAGILVVLGTGVHSNDTDASVVALPSYLFARAFPDRHMSETLRQLYTILRVPVGKKGE